MLKKILFSFTLIVVILFYEDIGWGDNWRQKDNAPSPAAKEEEFLEEDAFPEYRFEIEMESAGEISAKLDIQYFNNTGRALDEMKILLPANILYSTRYIEIKGLEVLNRSFTYFQSDEEIEVSFWESLMPGERVEISLNFSTVLPVQADIFGYYQGVLRLSCWHPVIAPYNKEKGIWANFDNISFGDPYYFEAARYKGTIKVPAPWQLISPFTSGVEEQDGGYIFSFDSKLPARDCTFVIGSKFKQSQEKFSSFQVDYFFQGKDRGFSQWSTEIMEFFSSWLGDYPYHRLVVVDIPLEGNMGMEFAGMIFLSTSYAQVGLQTLAHEIAHQYWYGLIGSDQIKEPWVDEGLASYSALLYLENEYGRDTYEQMIRKVPKESRYISYLPISFYPDKEAYKEAVYTRSALFWHEMRELGGKEKLFQVLGQVQKDFRFQIMSGENLLAVLKEEYGLNNHEMRQILFE